MEHLFSEKNITVCRMSKEDLPFILKMQNDSNLSAWSQDDYANELLRSDSIALTIKENVELKGFVMARLITSDNSIEIYNIAVNINDRRKGFAKLLLNEILKRYCDTSIEAIWLEVRASNSDALSFYKSYGFETAGTRNKFYAKPVEDAYIMKLDFAERRKRL